MARGPKGLRVWKYGRSFETIRNNELSARLRAGGFVTVSEPGGLDAFRNRRRANSKPDLTEVNE